MSAAVSSLTEELETDEQEQSVDDVWGERAHQLVDFVKANKPPVAKKMQIVNFAQRKGWEQPTRDGILKYCIEHKLLVAYQAVSGPAFKIPFTPVFDVADGDLPPVAEEPARTACLCSRTAPHPNYGCPEHGGARPDTTTSKEKQMAKDWISRAETAALLGIAVSSVCNIDHHLESRKLGDVPKAPREFKRASVIAWRDHKRGDMLDEPKKKPAKAPPQREPKAIAAKVARKSAAPISAASGGLADDLRMLLRCVDRGWLSQEDAFAKLRAIAESL